MPANDNDDPIPTEPEAILRYLSARLQRLHAAIKHAESAIEELKKNDEADANDDAVR